MPIEKLYQLFLSTKGVCTDTRKIEKDCLFVALKGENFNGNKFAKEAISKGAKYVIIDEEAFFEAKENTILVPNALIALQQLASHHRKKLNTKVIALTGSNGKTTTKELIKATLGKKYNVLATKGNLNNHIGVPLTLLNLKKENEIAIVEMGANHLNEIEFLCNIAKPNFGLITNIGKAHIGEFGGYENIIKAKTELFNHLIKNNGFAFINADQNEILNFANSFDFDKKTTYGQSPFVDEIAIPENDNLFCKLFYNKKTINTKLIGAYNFINILAAITVAKKFEVEENLIIEAIENYKPNNNRSELVNTKNNKIILDAYNANPSSVKVALNNFAKIESKNKMVILGEMNELGSFAKQEHIELINNVKEIQNLSKAIFIGKQFKEIKQDGFMFFAKTDDAKDYLKINKFEKLFVLIKGSRTNKLENLLKYL